MADGSFSTGSVVTQLPFSSLRKKQLSWPVWQAMPPTCSTCKSTVSASQSSRSSRTFCTCPDCSPLRHSRLRERDQYTASPFSAVCSSASRFIHATVSTRPLAASCATAAIRPSLSHGTSSSQAFIRGPSVSHLYPAAAQMRLGLAHGEFAEVENARREHRIGFAFQHALREVLEVAGAARSNHRHADRLGNRARQRQIEAVARAVAVHAGEQDLARTGALHALCPVDDVDSRGAQPDEVDALHHPAGGDVQAGYDTFREPHQVLPNALSAAACALLSSSLPS